MNAALVSILTIFKMQSEDLSVRSLHDIEKLIKGISAVALGATVIRSFMVRFSYYIHMLF